MFEVGDKVRTIKGCRISGVEYLIKIVEVGRKWRQYDAVVGVKRQPGDLEWGTRKHIYLVKNLRAV